MTKHRRNLIGIAGGIIAAFILTAACYSPSLGGPFIFDDIPNLELLGDRGGLTSTDRFLEYIATPLSGPLGRPVSLASFTLNAQSWPADPWPFRVTNLFIHLINGLLIFFLARSIFATVHQRNTAEKLALLCTVLWLLHPLLVSTTAYVIQRMTQLCTLFTLGALLCYTHGRICMAQSPGRGWAWILSGMGVFGTLAVLSKESGILLPFYALVIEVSIFRLRQFAAPYRGLLLAVLCAPLCAVAMYLFFDYESMASGFEFRSFTVTERLMTQVVVVMDYLRQILAPQLAGLGIVHDDYPVSTGLLEPAITLISLLAIVGLMVFALWSRRKWPLLSLGILWFFAGHSLEAGPIPLELYFEHRNYLPSLGPIIALVSLLPNLYQRVGKALPIVILLLLATESFLTWQAASAWASEDKMMRIALIEHPTSLRAQQYVANRFILARRYDDALAVQEELATLYPSHASTQLSIMNLRCILGTLTEAEFDTLRMRLANSDHDLQIIGFLGPLLSNTESGQCPVLGFAELHSVFDDLLQNRKIAARSETRGAIFYHKGIADKLSGDLSRAIEQMDMSYSAKPDIDIRLLQTVWLLEAGETDKARHYLSLTREHKSSRLLNRNFREADIEALQQALSAAP